MSAVLDGLAQFFVPTQLLAVVALGLLAGQGEKQFPLATLTTYAFGLVVASILVAAALRARDIVPILLLTVATLAGIAVSVARPVPQVAKTTAAALTGGLIAFNSPPQAITIPSAVAAQIGAAIGALVTLAIVMVIAMNAERPWQRIGARVIGSWIGASGILVLALRLAR